MSESYVDTCFKSVQRRVINDGVYVINPKISCNIYLGIFDKSSKANYSLVGFPLTKEAHQLFIIKYCDENDYYTIRSLQSRLFLGVEKKDDGKYEGSILLQNSKSENFLTEWNIISDNDYKFELKNTRFNIMYNAELNIPFLSRTNKLEEQKFKIKKAQPFKSGLYYINSLLPQKYINFSKTEGFFLTQNKSDDGIFYVIFDKYDGCYSILNSKDQTKCYSLELENKISLSNFYNLDYQKFIIGLNNIKNNSYFICHKSTEFMFCNKKANDNNNEPLALKLTPIDNYQPSMNNNFQFKLLDTDKIDKQKIKNIMKIRYQKELIVFDPFNTNQQKLNDRIFENNFLLEKLEIPLSFIDIDENAFKNCKCIKYIKCHPKLLKLLSNPKNVEEIVVPQGTEFIDKGQFDNFTNIQFLSLPESLKFDHCDPETFKNIHTIKVFEGDPTFLKIIYKEELTKLLIPFYVKEIPEEICYGCKLLKEVQIEQDSRLKTIKSRAFANCNSLTYLKVPNTVKSISPDAFYGNKQFKLITDNKNLELSMVENLVINKNVTTITNEYKNYINITSIEIPLSVTNVEDNVLKSFQKIKYVNCDLKWINDFNIENIETVVIPETITTITKKDFENLFHLKFVSIPQSVNEIEEKTFDNCKELVSVKCGMKHLKYFNQKQIKELILNKQDIPPSLKYFEGFTNLEIIKIPKSISNIEPNTFMNCKKLMKIDHPNGKKLIYNTALIDSSQIKISINEFKGWFNLKTLEIPRSVTSIENGAFNDCVNIKILICDPKWYPYIPKNSIREITIPEYVEELEKGQFDEFYTMTKIDIRPKKINIKDPTIFDLCESLIIINCSSKIFDSLSNKTINRCNNKLKMKFECPIFNFQPDLNRVYNKTDIPINTGENLVLNKSSVTLDANFSSSKRGKATTVEDLLSFDSNSNKYAKYINQVLRYIHFGDFPHQSKPKNTSLDEISIVLGSIMHKIISNPLELQPITMEELAESFDELPIPVKIEPRHTQIYAILRLADEILNEKTNGSIAEIKTGEGKTFVIAVLAIILVKYGRTVDIVTSNMQLAKRDKHETQKYFNLFNIPISAFYNKKNDDKLLSSVSFASPEYFNEYNEYNKQEFSYFNLKAFDCPVVYSTSQNFEYYYLHTLFSMIPRKREFDVVLIDEVDNMLIDELKTPLMISKEINYDIAQPFFYFVYENCHKKVSEISKLLKKNIQYFGEFDIGSIEILKKAALEAKNKIKNVDYIVKKRKILIIDPNTSNVLPHSFWPNYVYEMVQIKEKLNPDQVSISFCQVTQQTYFNLYKKIAGVTGTIGNEDEQQILKKGYNVNTFKVPRNISSIVEIYYKTRPELIDNIFELVINEIEEKFSEQRPVLVIWDSKYNADNFIKAKQLTNAAIIDGVNQYDDQYSIQNAGKPGQITIATLAAARGVDIKLPKETLKNKGLHVIIPMKISNLRSLEQAVGRAGRQGQPGSVTILISKNDLYNKTIQFDEKNKNLEYLQHKFVKYIRENIQWVLCGPGKKTFGEKTFFPFLASYQDVLTILSSRIFLILKDEISTLNIVEKKVLNDFQDLVWIMIQTIWGSFFTSLQNDIINANNMNYCNRAYHDFIKELETVFPLDKCRSVTLSIKHFLSLYKKDEKELAFFYKNIIITKDSAILYCSSELEKYIEKIDRFNTRLFEIKAKFLLNIPDWTFKLGYNMYGAYSKIKKFVIPEKPAPPTKDLLTTTPSIDIYLDIDLIKTAMTFAYEAYNGGKFSNGNVIFKCNQNDICMPKFYCIEYLNKLFIVTRGSDSDVDWLTDFTCDEISNTINGNEIFFHRGFYVAARYILSNISYIIEREYEEIHFVGHSYAGAVSNVLCMLTKSRKEFKHKKISSYAFAPPPSMSRIPADIQDCMYSFINKNDVVPLCSLDNIRRTLNIDKPSRNFIDLIHQRAKSSSIEMAKTFSSFLDNHKESIYKILDNIKEIHVQRNIGNIFHIGFKNTTILMNCLVNENDLPQTINLMDALNGDHSMINYIESFKAIKIFS